MRRTVLTCSGALVLWCGAGVLEAQAVPTGVISGTVLDVTSNQPIGDVTVGIGGSLPSGVGRSSMPPPSSTCSIARTDSQGRFVFTACPSGRYTLRVRHEGYAHVRGAAVVLNEGQTVTGLTLRAGRNGSVTGTVRDDNGDPVVGVSVMVFNRRVVGFRPMLFPLPKGATSDDHGRFRIADLPPGDYLFCACTRDPLPIDKSMLNQVAPGGVAPGVVVRELKSGVMTFAPTFHPGKTRVADAVIVAVGYSDDRAGIDITMTAVRSSRVLGRVTGAASDISKTHNLALILEDEDPASAGISEAIPVVFAPDGTFEFVGVTPGRYTLEAFPANGKGLRASLSVSVSDRDVNGLEVALGPGATVRGRVEFSGGTARPDADRLEKSSIGLVPVLLTPAQLIGIGASGSVGYSSPLSRDGSFKMDDLPPGRYVVNVRMPFSIWQTVESISTADSRILHPVLDVPSAGHDAVVVTLSDDVMAVLEATLTLRDYELSSESRVAVFPVDRAFWDETYRAPGRFAVTGVGSTGVVGFPNMPAGEYYVVELVPEDGQMSPERMADWAKRASTVRLRPGEKTTVALKR